MPLEFITNHPSLVEFANDSEKIGDCGKLTITVGEGCAEAADDGGVQYVMGELLSNCAGKDSEGFEIGVMMSYDQAADSFRMVVEDSIPYPPDELERRLASLNSPEIPAESEGKSKKRKACKTRGQMGKATLRDALFHMGGGLAFEGSPEGHVVAVATWTRELMLHPLPHTQVPAYFTSDLIS